MSEPPAPHGLRPGKRLPRPQQSTVQEVVPVVDPPSPTRADQGPSSIPLPRTSLHEQLLHMRTLTDDEWNKYLDSQTPDTRRELLVRERTNPSEPPVVMMNQPSSRVPPEDQPWRRRADQEYLRTLTSEQRQAHLDTLSPHTIDELAIVGEDLAFDEDPPPLDRPPSPPPLPPIQDLLPPIEQLQLRGPSSIPLPRTRSFYGHILQIRTLSPDGLFEYLGRLPATTQLELMDFDHDLNHLGMLPIDQRRRYLITRPEGRRLDLQAIVGEDLITLPIEQRLQLLANGMITLLTHRLQPPDRPSPIPPTPSSPPDPLDEVRRRTDPMSEMSRSRLFWERLSQIRRLPLREQIEYLVGQGVTPDGQQEYLNLVRHLNDQMGLSNDEQREAYRMENMTLRERQDLWLFLDYLSTPFELGSSSIPMSEGNRTFHERLSRLITLSPDGRQAYLEDLGVTQDTGRELLNLARYLNHLNTLQNDARRQAYLETLPYAAQLDVVEYLRRVPEPDTPPDRDQPSPRVPPEEPPSPTRTTAFYEHLSQIRRLPPDGRVEYLVGQVEVTRDTRRELLELARCLDDLIVLSIAEQQQAHWETLPNDRQQDLMDFSNYLSEQLMTGSSSIHPPPMSEVNRTFYERLSQIMRLSPDGRQAYLEELGVTGITQLELLALAGHLNHLNTLSNVEQREAYSETLSFTAQLDLVEYLRTVQENSQRTVQEPSLDARPDSIRSTSSLGQPRRMRSYDTELSRLRTLSPEQVLPYLRTLLPFRALEFMELDKDMKLLSHDQRLQLLENKSVEKDNVINNSQEQRNDEDRASDAQEGQAPVPWFVPWSGMLAYAWNWWWPSQVSQPNRSSSNGQPPAGQPTGSQAPTGQQVSLSTGQPTGSQASLSTGQPTGSQAPTGQQVSLSTGQQSSAFASRPQGSPQTNRLLPTPPQPASASAPTLAPAALAGLDTSGIIPWLENLTKPPEKSQPPTFVPPSCFKAVSHMGSFLSVPSFVLYTILVFSCIFWHTIPSTYAWLRIVPSMGIVNPRNPSQLDRSQGWNALFTFFVSCIQAPSPSQPECINSFQETYYFQAFGDIVELQDAANLVKPPPPPVLGVFWTVYVLGIIIWISAHLQMKWNRIRRHIWWFPVISFAANFILVEASQSWFSRTAAIYNTAIRNATSGERPIINELTLIEAKAPRILDAFGMHTFNLIATVLTIGYFIYMVPPPNDAYGEAQLARDSCCSCYEPPVDLYDCPCCVKTVTSLRWCCSHRSWMKDVTEKQLHRDEQEEALRTAQVKAEKEAAREKRQADEKAAADKKVTTWVIKEIMNLKKQAAMAKPTATAPSPAVPAPAP